MRTSKERSRSSVDLSSSMSESGLVSSRTRYASDGAELSLPYLRGQGPESLLTQRDVSGSLASKRVFSSSKSETSSSQIVGSLASRAFRSTSSPLHSTSSARASSTISSNDAKDVLSLSSCSLNEVSVFRADASWSLSACAGVRYIRMHRAGGRTASTRVISSRCRRTSRSA